jgi:NitT/TauT family transport system substrate-binding protein
MSGTSRKIRLAAGAALALGALLYADAGAQPTPKKVRMGISSSNVSFLAMFTAQRMGFYKDEGIDLELIYMPANLASTAVMSGDVDYNGAVTGVIGAAVRGQPMKVLLFTVGRPLLFLMSRNEIKEVRQLKGKKVAGSSPAGSATILAMEALRKYGLEPGKDVSILPMAGAAAGRFAILESGAVDASLLSAPENIMAQERGYNELIFLGDVVDYPQNGFGSSEKRIRENPDEVYKMVRGTLRGLKFIWDKNNQEQVLDVIMKQFKLQDRKMASEMQRHVMRVLTKDAAVKPESIQNIIDLARENAKVTRPISIREVVDYSFVERARKELGMAQ